MTKHPNKVNFKPNADGTGRAHDLAAWKFDCVAIRKAPARMVIIDELHFKIVEGEVSNNLCLLPV